MQRPYVQKPTVQSTLSKTKSICRYVFSHTHLKKTAKKRNNLSSAPRKKKSEIKRKNGVNLNCIFWFLLKGLNNRILNGLFVLSMQYVD